MSTTRTDKSSSAGAQFAESPSLNASTGHIKLVGTVGKEKTYTPQQGQEERPYIPIDLTVSWEKDGKTYTKEGNDVYVQFRACRYVPGSTKDHAAVSGFSRAARRKSAELTLSGMFAHYGLVSVVMRAPRCTSPIVLGMSIISDTPEGLQFDDQSDYVLQEPRKGPGKSHTDRSLLSPLPGGEKSRRTSSIASGRSRVSSRSAMSSIAPGPKLTRTAPSSVSGRSSKAAMTVEEPSDTSSDDTRHTVRTRTRALPSIIDSVAYEGSENSPDMISRLFALTTVREVFVGYLKFSSPMHAYAYLVLSACGKMELLDRLTDVSPDDVLSVLHNLTEGDVRVPSDRGGSGIRLLVDLAHAMIESNPESAASALLNTIPKRIRYTCANGYFGTGPDGTGTNAYGIALQIARGSQIMMRNVSSFTYHGIVTK
ncbi:hypothetical protein JB92DRAFT_3110793 [Gautieria morchelliformis]|nr:hypothetical protein JB92DRAFT_3110793 [Gautieria morchelliformis]